MAEKPIIEQSTEEAPTQQATLVQSSGPSTERADSEHRQAYGTAKTENLRDSGLWRFILPTFVILLCLALLAIPLIILIWLLVISLDAQSPIGPLSLSWVWITMIVLAVIIAGVIIRGLTRIFLTQAENYHS